MVIIIFFFFLKYFHQKIDDLANKGLRTLLICQREVSENEVEEYLSVLFPFLFELLEFFILINCIIFQEYEKASKSLEDREIRIFENYDRLEKEFTFLGFTAVEDKLQDQAPETIQYLKECGINFWLLTGDKLETAISISAACNILKLANNKLVFFFF